MNPDKYISGQAIPKTVETLGGMDFWQIFTISLLIVIPILVAVVLMFYFKYQKISKNGNGAPSSNGKAVTVDNLQAIETRISAEIVSAQNNTALAITQSEERLNARMDKSHEWLKRIDEENDEIREKVGEVRGMLLARPAP